jgi:hypothetical protein
MIWRLRSQTLCIRPEMPSNRGVVFFIVGSLGNTGNNSVFSQHFFFGSDHILPLADKIHRIILAFSHRQLPRIEGKPFGQTLVAEQ